MGNLLAVVLVGLCALYFLGPIFGFDLTELARSADRAASGNSADGVDDAAGTAGGEDGAAGAGVGRGGAEAGDFDLPNTETAAMLRALEVRDPMTAEEVPAYERSAFGQRWADVDRNGCDTRNDILARDLARPVFKEGTRDCVVISGTLAEPYTGSIIEFQRGEGTSDLVQIDHVVALADAWQAGAWQWDAPTRERFANAPENLLAVDGKANQEKGASTADLWLPPNKDFRCDYVSRQIKVKYGWGLSVTPTEREAMADVLKRCG